MQVAPQLAGNEDAIMSASAGAPSFRCFKYGWTATGMQKAQG